MRLISLRKILALAAGLLALAGGAAQAQDLTGTLARIKRDGQVRVGHRESSIPFSYYDHTGQVVGYSQDYSNLIVAAIKKELGLPALKVSLVPINSQNRIPRLLAGDYDFECGSTTNTLERQKQVGFSYTIFIVGARLLVHKDSGIRDFEDLKGKTVAVTAGTTSEELLSSRSDFRRLGLNIISAEDHGDSFRLVESGQAEAFFIDDALLAGERAEADNPKDWLIVGAPQSFEAYGCMFRKGDAKFKKLLNDTIIAAQESGAALKSYNRWFRSEIPLKSGSLNFDLSDVMKQLFASPNDKAFQ